MATAERSARHGERPIGVTRVLVLGAAVGVLVVVACSAGLLGGGSLSERRVVSVRGMEVELYGRGVYRHDSLFMGAGNRGTDLAVLVVVVPLLVVSLRRLGRVGAGGPLLAGGAFSTLAYVFASRALGAMYTKLLIVHVAIFSGSLFGAVLTLGSVDRMTLAALWPQRGPHTLLSRPLAGAGAVTLGVWLVPLLSALIRDEPPELLEHYTTMVTHVVDLAVVTPAALLAAVLAARRDPRTPLLAVPLLVLLVSLLPIIVAQTSFQLDAGYDFTPGEVIGPIAGFLLLAAAGAVALRRTLLSVAPSDLDTQEGFPGR